MHATVRSFPEQPWWGRAAGSGGLRSTPLESLGKEERRPVRDRVFLEGGCLQHAPLGSANQPHHPSSRILIPGFQVNWPNGFSNWVPRHVVASVSLHSPTDVFLWTSDTAQVSTLSIFRMVVNTERASHPSQTSHRAHRDSATDN